MSSIEIAGITLPLDAGADGISQSYADATPTTTLQMGDGSRYRQQYAAATQKIDTTITATGVWAPAPLQTLDPTTPVLLRCGVPRAIYSATAAIALPSARRSDTGYTPKGFALVGGRMVPTTTASLVGDTLTLDTVAGATGYIAYYWPEITVYADYSEQGAQGSAAWSWTLSCKEQ